MIKVGDVFSSNSFGDFEIISNKRHNDVVVRFLDTGYVTSTFRSCIAKGAVKDKLRPTCCGVGFIGDGKYKSSLHSKAYSVWSSMISRCYNKNSDSYLNYGHIGVLVSSDWHNFQNFAEWYYENHPSDGFEYELDKDIKKKGNKLYCADYCMFVSKGANIEAAKAKVYKLISPSGDFITIRNLAQFCADNGLSRGGMKSVVYENRLSYKGWKLQETKSGITKNPENKNAKTYKLVSPDGELVIVTNMERFCRERSMHSSLINKVLSGERLSHKGWRRP